MATNPLRSPRPAVSNGPAAAVRSFRDAGPVFEALSSETARTILEALYDRPGTASELADRVDTSIQNVHYHLQKLQSADLVDVVDTCYSTKGAEMDVYAPTNDPLVLSVGGSANESPPTDHLAQPDTTPQPGD